MLPLPTIWIYYIPPGENGRYFAGNDFQVIHSETFFALIKISLKCVPKGPIDNDTAFGSDDGLAPICHTPLSEPMQTRFTYGEMS